MKNPLPKLLAILTMAIAANYFVGEASASILAGGDASTRQGDADRGDKPSFSADSALGMSALEFDSSAPFSEPRETRRVKLKLIDGPRSLGSTTSRSSSAGSSLSMSGVVSPLVGIEASPRTHAVWREAPPFIPDTLGSELLDPPRTWIGC